METPEKTCKKCSVTKPLTEFSTSRGKPRGACKRCYADMMLAAKKADPEKFKKRKRDYYWKDVEASRAAMRARFSTPEARAKQYKYMKDHPEYKKNYDDKLRSDVINKYGGKCVHCGETTPEFLVIDHINNDGTEQRKSIPGVNGGNSFYRKIRQMNYPAGLQVLCSSCNWRKERARRINKNVTIAKYYAKAKREALEKYGLCCKCCGETDEIVLCLDHINDDGADHREEVTGSRKGGGVRFYITMRKLGYPPGLQTLCWNCNVAKGRFGACPHQTPSCTTPQQP